jgi:hypothetical protein
MANQKSISTDHLAKSTAQGESDSPARNRPGGEATRWFVPPLVIPVLLFVALVGHVAYQAFFWESFYLPLPRGNASEASWTGYAKMRDLIEKQMFSQVEDLLPIISFGSKKDGKQTRNTASSSSGWLLAAIPNARFAGGVVHAGEAGGLSTYARAPMHISDRWPEVTQW